MPTHSPAHRAALLLIFAGGAIAVTGILLITGAHRGWSMPLLAAGFMTVILGSIVSGRTSKGDAAEKKPEGRA